MKMHSSLALIVTLLTLAAVLTGAWLWLRRGVGLLAARIDDLRHTHARTKFLSIEPLLGPIADLNLSGIDWVIVGGESGPGARPIQRNWVVDIRRQCRQAGVAFFFKQWGGVNKKKTGRKLDGRTYDEMPITQNDEGVQQSLSLVSGL